MIVEIFSLSRIKLELKLTPQIKVLAYEKKKIEIILLSLFNSNMKNSVAIDRRIFIHLLLSLSRKKEDSESF